jgi:energy-coupling factor transporter ATP-binding protein EcfA2
MGFPSKQQVLDAAKHLSLKDEGVFVRTNGLWHVLVFLRHRACHETHSHYTFESYDLAQAVFDLNGVTLPVTEDSRDVYFEPGATQGSEFIKMFRHREGPRQTYLNRIYTGLVGAGPRQPKLFDASNNALPTTVNLVAEWIPELRSLGDNKLILDTRIQSLMTWLFRFGIPTSNGHTANIAEHSGNGRLNVTSSCVQAPVPEDEQEFKTGLSKFFALTIPELDALFPELARVNIAAWSKTVAISPATLGADLKAFLDIERPASNAENGGLAELVATFIAAAHHDAKLLVEPPAFTRVVCSLLSKRFIVLTGLAGSGKTKLAQALAEWLTPKRAAFSDTSPHFSLVPVGADWTGNDNLVGYPNGLDSQSYNSKPALELILNAKDHPEVPHFLILDEMNLSHVERYFADILSAMESEAAIPLHQDEQRTANGREIPNAIVLPPNLFIIGTVNVDETTYMFSPKVLDRANVIEFRMEAEEIAAFLEAPKAVRLGELNGKGAGFGQNFVTAAADKSRAVPEVVKDKFKEEMLLFFKLLQKHHAEFGYRTSYEAGRFMHFFKELGGYADDDATWFAAAMDAVIVQKLLPKLHGSRTKLEGLLWALGYACGADWGKMSAAEFQAACLDAGDAQNESKYSPEAVHDALKGAEARYPLSFDKILRMYRKLVRDQFVTFAEA